jgi:3-hydroxyisobutyrate dehydrogenase
VCQDTIITVLPNDAACDSVYLDPSTGILAGVKQATSSSPPKIAMECGTMSLEIINRIRDASSQCGLRFVDAPISGGPLGAKAGTLTIMVGCNEPLFPQIKPLLAHMGTSIRRCGAVGSGTAFKTINNYMSITQVLVASEALNIGAKLNLNMEELIDTINSSSGQSWITSKNNPVPGITPGGAASNDYEGGFRIELGQKDLRLGVQLAKMAGAKPLLSIETLKTLEEVASDPRYAGKDLRVVYKWLNEQ